MTTFHAIAHRALCAALGLYCLAAAPAPLLPDGVVLRLPLPSACISSPFGPRRAVGPRAALMHNGIDLPAPAGTWVTAVASGHVIAVRRLGSSGLEVDITHAPGLFTRYAHLGTVAPAFAEGRTAVAVGDRIGRVGRTGVTYGTHLHFEVHLGGQVVDPAPFLGVEHC